jgi:hypothetical protein
MGLENMPDFCPGPIQQRRSPLLLPMLKMVPVKKLGYPEFLAKMFHCMGFSKEMPSRTHPVNKV